MDFENNPINTTIWKYLNEAEAAIKDDSKSFFFKKINVLDLIVDITITDKEFIDKMTSKEVNEDTLAEVLAALLPKQRKGVRIKLLEILMDSLDNDELTKEEKKLTTFLKCRLFKLSQN